MRSKHLLLHDWASSMTLIAVALVALLSQQTETALPMLSSHTLLVVWLAWMTMRLGLGSALFTVMMGSDLVMFQMSSSPTLLLPSALT
nr:protein D [Redspotted grouper nervous necrosis virus]